MTGTRMAEMARELGLSQADIGRRLGYSQAAISKWFAGEPAPPLVQHIFECRRCRRHFLEGKVKQVRAA